MKDGNIMIDFEADYSFQEFKAMEDCDMSAAKVPLKEETKENNDSD